MRTDQQIYYIEDIDLREKIDLHVLDPPPGYKKKLPKYFREVCAFDIETTTLKKYEQAVMYIWQFAIDDMVIYGRTWEQFLRLINDLSTRSQARVYVGVHNLSYEFQFLKGILQFDDVFAMDRRRILSARCGNIEFHCTYLLTNMSLDRFIKSVGGTYEKLDDFDYTKKRYPWTRMSERELLYCVNDVRGLTSALIKKMELDQDTLYTLPRTSTGYVRRIFHAEARPLLRWLRSMLPDLEVFNALRGCFRGGNTHANRWNAGRILEHVHSFDISSSYPAVMLTEKFPCKFHRGKPEYFGYYLKYGKAVLFYIQIEDLRLKDDAWGCPYISKSKCDYIRGGVYDNGRVLSADSCGFWINEIDMQIITNEYDFNFTVKEVFYADKRPLPIGFRKLIRRMYENKTLLKKEGGYEYARYKALLNSIYGLFVQNPVKFNFRYDPDTGMIREDESETVEDLIRKYQTTGWLPYQIGVWVTSYARLRLEKGLNAIPPQAFIYADTDSIKFQGDEYIKNFDALNDELRNSELCAPDQDGKMHYIGVYEYEGCYRRFKTLGAKKYVYEDDDGVHITIAGVNKRIGADELQHIDNFKEGFTFTDAGGLQSVYNDDPDMILHLQGHDLQITSNVALLPSSYTLGITGEYELLLNILSNVDIRQALHYER